MVQCVLLVLGFLPLVSHGVQLNRNLHELERNSLTVICDSIMSNYAALLIKVNDSIPLAKHEFAHWHTFKMVMVAKSYSNQCTSFSADNGEDALCCLVLAQEPYKFGLCTYEKLFALPVTVDDSVPSSLNDIPGRDFYQLLYLYYTQCNYATANATISTSSPTATAKGSNFQTITHSPIPTKSEISSTSRTLTPREKSGNRIPSSTHTKSKTQTPTPTRSKNPVPSPTPSKSTTPTTTKLSTKRNGRTLRRSSRMEVGTSSSSIIGITTRDYDDAGIYYVDLFTLECDPPEDNSLCTQFCCDENFQYTSFCETEMKCY